MLYKTLVDNPDLAPEVAERSGRLENFQLTGNVLHFTLERHPHLFGRASKGMASAGFFIVEQRYAFDLDLKTICLMEEECTDIVANVDELVHEDVTQTLESIDLRDFDKCTIEAEVRILAEEQADGIAMAIQDNILLPDPAMLHNESLRQEWEDFCIEFVKLWSAAFVDAILERWKELKEEEEDFA